MHHALLVLWIFKSGNFFGSFGTQLFSKGTLILHFRILLFNVLATVLGRFSLAVKLKPWNATMKVNLYVVMYNTIEVYFLHF